MRYDPELTRNMLTFLGPALERIGAVRSASEFGRDTFKRAIRTAELVDFLVDTMGFPVPDKSDASRTDLCIALAAAAADRKLLIPYNQYVGGRHKDPWNNYEWSTYLEPKAETPVSAELEDATA